jgi:hypothetical protein
VAALETDIPQGSRFVVSFIQEDDRTGQGVCLTREIQNPDDPDLVTTVSFLRLTPDEWRGFMSKAKAGYYDDILAWGRFDEEQP